MKISVFPHCKLKETIQIIIKSLIHATLNSNMTLNFRSIISTGVLYNGDFENMISKITTSIMISQITRLKFDNMFKAT